jgi:hypothetical protein
MPGQSLRVPGGWGFQFARQSAHEGGKIVGPMHRLPIPLRKYSWYSFLLEAGSTQGPSGIEPVTFQLVHFLNQLHCCVSSIIILEGHLKSQFLGVYVPCNYFCWRQNCSTESVGTSHHLLLPFSDLGLTLPVVYNPEQHTLFNHKV